MGVTEPPVSEPHCCHSEDTSLVAKHWWHRARCCKTIGTNLPKAKRPECCTPKPAPAEHTGLQTSAVSKTAPQAHVHGAEGSNQKAAATAAPAGGAHKEVTDKVMAAGKGRLTPPEHGWGQRRGKEGKRC